MKVSIIQSGSGDPTWSHTVQLTQGVQRFNLDFKGTRTEAEEYAKLFCEALEDHDTEYLASAVLENPTPEASPTTAEAKAANEQVAAQTETQPTASGATNGETD